MLLIFYCYTIKGKTSKEGETLFMHCCANTDGQRAPITVNYSVQVAFSSPTRCDSKDTSLCWTLCRTPSEREWGDYFSCQLYVEKCSGLPASWLLSVSKASVTVAGRTRGVNCHFDMQPAAFGEKIGRRESERTQTDGVIAPSEINGRTLCVHRQIHTY